MRSTREPNAWHVLIYNALREPIAAGVLYPAFGLLLSPMIAALAMSLVSVSVVFNALRLRTLDRLAGKTWADWISLRMQNRLRASYSGRPRD